MSDSGAGFQLRCTEDLLGLVPYLVGYAPERCVIVCFVDAGQRVHVSARFDIAAPPTAVATQVHMIAAQQRCRSVLVVGYAPLAESTTVSKLVRSLAGRVKVTEAVVVHDGRYFCVNCPCPAAGGVAFDASGTATAAQATFDGMVALASRADLLALANPDPSEQAATRAAMAVMPDPAGDAGQAVVRYLMDQASDGIRLSAGQVARMAVLLSDIELRDAAWQATSGHMWQRDLWLDLTRRVPQEYVAGPATLAAWCAWMRGENTLAMAALRRVLTVDTGYRLALMIAHAVHGNIAARDVVPVWPLTPAAVDAADRA